MIRIGLSDTQKQLEIKKYVEENSIEHVIVFSPEKLFMDLPNLDIPIRQISYNEIIMYRTFYPLLEEIDKSYLLVANELMRDKNRNCLTYNCYAKYTNQTEHRMVFNYHPIIEEKKDVLILLDFSDSQRRKGFGIGDIDLGEYDIQCVRKKYKISIVNVPIPDDAVAQYEDEKSRLFDELGNKDPDTVPRNLHLWTGKFKKLFLDDNAAYIARNKRMKMKNIDVYKDAVPGKDYVLIDMPWRRLEFNDFLRTTGQENLKYLSTGFSVDAVYINAFNKWTKEVGTVYAETGVYKKQC